ncbi:paraflagellar rod protein, putative [Leishmania tarentolae]|uniref:Paraflagellar rod protein, putative n=1 Tax=Leishmania tarentolae TaxID=5689 RepID=A0A640K9P5_LEITA|nr:paraflagellar rod protein, putative [Leishmania tarentolae]
MPPAPSPAAAPIASGSGSGCAATCDDAVLPALETSTALSTSHAQLVLLECAIRAAAGNAAPSDAPAPAESGSSSGIMAATRPSSVTAAAPSRASERLHALHDNLQRVRRLMQEYEEASQRVINIHLIPSTETGEKTLGSVSTPTVHAGKKAEVSPQQPGVSVVSTAASATDRLRLEQHSPPSLHQRRALASDAVFTRFCGLRVAPDQFLLPLPPPTSPTTSPTPQTFPQKLMSPRTPAALRGIDSIVEEKKSENDDSLVGYDSEPVKTRGNNNKTRGGQTSGSPNTKTPHSSSSSSPKDSPLPRTVQQRRSANVKVVLEEYAKLFYLPSTTAVSSQPPAQNGKGTTAENLSMVALADDAGVVRQLQETQRQVAALQQCRLFSYEAHLRSTAASADNQCGNNNGSGAANGVSTLKRGAASARAATTGAQVDDISWEHIPVAVQHIQDSLTALQARFTRDSHYASCGESSVALVHELHIGTQPLIHKLRDLLSKATLEEMDENTREKLRRMKFDAEELQQAQAQAITNGDMQHSEELYYEQASLAEAMEGPFEELEQLILKYKEVYVDAPLARVLEQRDLLTTRLTRMIEEHASKLSEVALDVERVKEKRRAVAQARHRQRSNMTTYNHSWKKAWQTNSDQQMACYRAMEQLEKQLSDLQQAQSFLVDDWISHIAQERQREEDAAAFACFADARAAALAETQRNLQAVVEGLRQYSGAVEFSCHHVEAFVREVLQDNIRHTQVTLRKDRLEQFRALYLTLGDLRFKKARSTEEIEKKIEYYKLQQEVAMDTLNPKAKEFSKAKKRYEAAKAEAQKQVDELDQRSRLQLERFRPTEKLLREAGVNFVSPEEELARRTQQRSQKLLEYQQLLEDGIGVRPTTNVSGTPSSSARTENAKGLSGTSTPQPPRLQAVGSLHPYTQTPTAGEAAHSTATTSGTLNGKNGRQLPPLHSMNHTYPPPQCTGDGDDADPAVPTANPLRQAAKQTSSTSAVAPPPEADSLSNLHATEECIMQSISKMALINRWKTRTNSGTMLDRFKKGKR